MGALCPRPTLENKMGQVSLKNYITKKQKGDPKYRWPLEGMDKKETKRQKIHKGFPYVVTYHGHYGLGSLLNDMEDWCRKNFGDCDGECYWEECPESWETWYGKTGLEDILDKELNDERKIYPKPDIDDEKAMKQWVKKDNARDVIGKHFEMIKTVEGQPPEIHYHTGKWMSFFIMKTGYDYGYEDYCFKNEEDAFYFKLIWAEEAEIRA